MQSLVQAILEIQTGQASGYSPNNIGRKMLRLCKMSRCVIVALMVTKKTQGQKSYGSTLKKVNYRKCINKFTYTRCTILKDLKAKTAKVIQKPKRRSKHI